MSCRCYDFYVKSDFFLKLFCKMSNACTRHDQLLEHSSRISESVDDLIIPVFCLCIYKLTCCCFCILTCLLACQQEVEIIRYVKQCLSLLKIFRMFFLNCHQLIYSVKDSFLDTGSCIQFIERNSLVNFFIHTLCTVITVSDSISDYFFVFVKKNKVYAPGIYAHAYRNLANLFAFLKTCYDFFEDTVKFPAEFAVFLNHSILKTMDFFEFDLSVFHMAKDQTSTGCTHIYCCIISCHCKILLNM